jgi:hypothetical protein
MNRTKKTKRMRSMTRRFLISLTSTVFVRRFVERTVLIPGPNLGSSYVTCQICHRRDTRATCAPGTMFNTFMITPCFSHFQPPLGTRGGVGTLILCFPFDFRSRGVIRHYMNERTNLLIEAQAEGNPATNSIMPRNRTNP